MPHFVVFSHAPKRGAGVGHKVSATTRLAAAKHVFAKGGWPTSTVYVCDDTQGDKCEKYEMRVIKVSPTSKVTKPKTKSHGKSAKGVSSKIAKSSKSAHGGSGKKRPGGFKSLASSAMRAGYAFLLDRGMKATKGEVAEVKRLAMGAIYEQLLLKEHAPAASKKRHNAALAGRNAEDYAIAANLSAQSVAFTKKLAQEGMHEVYG
jgi:hypothetical protein